MTAVRGADGAKGSPVKRRRSSMLRVQGKWQLLSVRAATGMSGGVLTTNVGPAGAGPLEQDHPLPNTITVSGDGDAGGQPDVAYVNVGVQTQGATAAAATAENSRLMAAVLDALRALG